MNNKKIGNYICTLRKKKNLTQKELADQLGVTDKAVSKWERGAGYPDISMLKPLSDVLGTTVNELLEGENLEQGEAINKESINNALEYANKIISLMKYSKGKMIAALLAISLLLAIFTCVIVNVAVNHQLSWSFIVLGACIMGGSLFIPPLLNRKRGFIISLCFLTILIMPLLGIIQAFTSNWEATFERSGWLWSMAFPITLTWLVILWLIVFFTVRRKKTSLWFLLSIGTLLCIPGQLITNYVIDQYVKSADAASRQISNVSSFIAILMLAGIFIVIGLVKRKPAAKLI